ncbi:chromosomal replication initiator protein [Ereboglobus sp. PH5-5]|uniref:chromosomal replication initiator protein DnaA n=1 Tax=unclassified Ereboglobus TaxID=2626932 RepID=UPI002404C699|nr:MULTISPECIES: chromosomal replication initiator protein DnaA [unclassified Ereboglobus]MDF9826383.1 chromosomal replication initiator protein [Ereboglobus sp. PH5-10]MDF9832998.1 chromosomal replication initiator protein [Ereboglobus sp. PH5-5]
MPTLSAPSIWEAVKNDFKTLFSDEVYHMWFNELVCLEQTDTAITLGAATDFAAYFVHDNYLDLIKQRLQLATGTDYTVRVKKNPSVATPAAPAQTAAAAERRHNRVAAAERPPVNGTLAARNTFENYIIGENNMMAHAAAMRVAQSPGQAYNPLFITGSTGLGKTHLMHAIGHAVLKSNPHAKVIYLTTERFTNEYVQAIRENALVAFRRRYRNVDVLLLDDIQFLGGKEGIQEEFYHTFNDLHTAGKQIVISSDRRASEIKDLEARLVSRFEWGLPTDIQAPNYETRLAILRSKAAFFKYELPGDVLEFIAKNVAKNIRALEGALIKVASTAFLLKTGPIDVTLAEKLLQPILIEQAQSQLTIDAIQKRVSDHYELRPGDMVSKRRPANIAFPRQIAMYLARQLTKHSLQEIGAAFGGRDHGTVIHACKTVENMMEQDPSARHSVEYLRVQLSR